MKKIVSAHLIYYRNEAHYGLMAAFRGLLDRFEAVKSVVAATLGDFVNLLALEGSLVDSARANSYTQPIAEADHRVDRTLTGIGEVVAAGLHHFDPAVVAAARALHSRLSAFGRIAGKAYEEEEVAVQRLLEELHGAYAAQVAALGLRGWVAELEAASAEFKALMQRRFEEAAGKPKERLPAVRRQVDVAYHAMADRISAAATVSDDPARYSEFIDLLNVEIAYFNEHDEHGHQHHRHDLQHAAVDSIADQPFAGKPVTPIPVVRYTDSKGATQELTFAKDFTLTYKDNDRAGTAEVIVHGKGGYKGTKAVTFTIAAIG
jgi:hypothetical protein